MSSPLNDGSPAEHQVVLIPHHVYSPSKWSAQCTCGWKAKPQKTHVAAARDRDRHLISAGVIPKPFSIEGIVRLHRSESAECICCRGKHVYSLGIEVKPAKSKVYRVERSRYDDFIHDWVSEHRDALEGRKLRITVEVIE